MPLRFWNLPAKTFTTVLVIAALAAVLIATPAVSTAQDGPSATPAPTNPVAPADEPGENTTPAETPADNDANDAAPDDNSADNGDNAPSNNDADADGDGDQTAVPEGYATPEEAVAALEKLSREAKPSIDAIVKVLIEEERENARRFYRANIDKFEKAGVEILEVKYNEAKDQCTLTIKFTGNGTLAALPPGDVEGFKRNGRWFLSIDAMLNTYNELSISFLLMTVLYSIIDLEGIEDGDSLDIFGDDILMDEESFEANYPDFERKDVTIRIIDRDAMAFALVCNDADPDDNDRTPIGTWEMDQEGNLKSVDE